MKDNKFRIIYIILILTWLSCETKSKRIESWPYPEMSTSIEESISDSLFMGSYDVVSILDGDTSELDNFGWGEYVWKEEVNYNGVKMKIRKNELQLVFNRNSELMRCQDDHKKCRYEISDLNDSYCAYMMGMYRYKLNTDSLPDVIVLKSGITTNEDLKLIFSLSE